MFDFIWAISFYRPHRIGRIVKDKHTVVNRAPLTNPGASAIQASSNVRAKFRWGVSPNVSSVQRPVSNANGGLIINRFRGDIDLFKTGVQWIESRTARSVLGVLPWSRDFSIEAEDAVVIDRESQRRPRNPHG